MSENFLTQYKCQKCGGTPRHGFELLYSDHWECGLKGTAIWEKSEQPTAAGGTDTARTSDGGSAESEARSAVAEEARALTGGSVELWRRVDDIVDEARAVWAGFQGLNDVRTEAAFRKVWHALLELRKDLKPEVEIDPAVSAALSNISPEEKR